jgi:hypothetical protein
MTASDYSGHAFLEELSLQQFPHHGLRFRIRAFGREPNAWFDRDSPRLIRENAETPAAVDFHSSLLITIDRDSRTDIASSNGRIS